MMSEIEMQDRDDSGGTATADLLRTIGESCACMKAARKLGDADLINGADDNLHVAVDAARGAGVLWGPIGAAMGIARGNAYQRYRRHPTVDFPATSAAHSRRTVN